MFDELILLNLFANTKLDYWIPPPVDLSYCDPTLPSFRAIASIPTCDLQKLFSSNHSWIRPVFYIWSQTRYTICLRRFFPGWSHLFRWPVLASLFPYDLLSIGLYNLHMLCFSRLHHLRHPDDHDPCLPRGLHQRDHRALPRHHQPLPRDPEDPRQGQQEISRKEEKLCCDFDLFSLSLSLFEEFTVIDVKIDILIF